MKARHDLLAQTWADKVDVQTPYVPGANLRVDAALRLLDGGAAHLDLGCGAGVLGQAVRRRFRETHGLELSEVAVASAVARGVQARQWDLEEMPYPYPDAAFDAVTLLSVIQYIFDPVALLREVRRLLRPGGTVLVGFPNMRAVWRVARLLFGGRFPKVSADPGYDGGTIRYFCARDVTGLLHKAGLETLGVSGVYTRPRWLEGGAGRIPALGRLRVELLCAEVILRGWRPLSP